MLCSFYYRSQCRIIQWYRSSSPLVTVSRSTSFRRSSVEKVEKCVQKTVEVIRASSPSWKLFRLYYRSCRTVRWNRSSFPLVIQLVPQERIQERIAEQVVVIALPQIMEEILFSSTYASDSYRRTDRGRLHSQDSGGNFRVCVIGHAFHLAQILRASRHPFPSVFFFRAVRRSLKPVTPLEPLMESYRTAVTESIDGSLSAISGFYGIIEARKSSKLPR